MYSIYCFSECKKVNSLMHPVILNMAMEGYLVADVDVNGVALNAVLFMFLLLRVKVQSSGFAPLSRCLRVGRRLYINRLLQCLCILLRLRKDIPGLYVMFAAIFGRSCAGGSEHEEVEEPQNRNKEAGLRQKKNLP